MSDDSDCLPGGGARMASVIRDAYGFDAVVVGERLEGGYANDLSRINAHGDAFVLRLKHPPVIEDDIAWEHALTRLLSRSLPEVPLPVPPRVGSSIVDFRGRVGWLVRFIDGEPARPARTEHRTAAARGSGAFIDPDDKSCFRAARGCDRCASSNARDVCARRARGPERDDRRRARTGDLPAYRGFTGQSAADGDRPRRLLPGERPHLRR